MEKMFQKYIGKKVCITCDNGYYRGIVSSIFIEECNGWVILENDSIINWRHIEAIEVLKK